MHVRASDGSVSNEFLDRFKRTVWLDVGDIAGVGIGGDVVLLGKLRQGKILHLAIARRIARVDPDPKRPLFQTFFNQFHDPVELLLSCDVKAPWIQLLRILKVARNREGICVRKRRNAAERPRSGSPIVDWRLLRPQHSVPVTNWEHAGLKLKNRRHPLHNLHTHRGQTCPMRVNVDKTWRDNMTSRVNHGVAVQFKFTDRDDLAIIDGHIADGIKPRFGVDHPTAHNDDVIGQNRRSGHQQSDH